MTEINDYDSALDFIHHRPRFRKKATLQRMRDLLQRLGNPQNGLTYIHITGTNGKGSTTAFVRSLLDQHGLSVGTFTSPFITRFNERIQIDGQPISDQDLIKYTQIVAKAAADMEKSGEGPTEFETDTAIMFLYFHDCQPDIAVLEVGIGGKWDSTNVIPAPLVAAIVTVGYDHMRYLGNSLSEIAGQKAGIIKPGTSLVTGKLSQSAMEVVSQTAKQYQVRQYSLGRDFYVEPVKDGLLYPKIKYSGLGIHNLRADLGLAGDYQIHNAAVAITIVQLTLKKLGLPLDLSAIKTGLKNVSWPGRMEVVNQEPLMILDGAHNLPGMQALVQSLKDDFAGRDIYVLLAILADKQADLMLGELASLPNVHIVLTQFTGPSQNRPSNDWDECIQNIQTHYPMKVIDDWQTALVEISKKMSAEDLLLATGSLYFISDIRHLLFYE